MSSATSDDPNDAVGNYILIDDSLNMAHVNAQSTSQAHDSQNEIPMNLLPAGNWKDLLWLTSEVIETPVTLSMSVTLRAVNPLCECRLTESRSFSLPELSADTNKISSELR